jgi:plastocyanin
MRLILASFLLASVVACGGGGDDGADDAPDAVPIPQTVSMVTCPDSTVDITASLTTYMPPSFTTTVGGIVHFNLAGGHDVVSTTAGQNFSLPLSANACLQFDAAGTFTFRCTPHGFNGTVIVQ